MNQASATIADVIGYPSMTNDDAREYQTQAFHFTIRDQRDQRSINNYLKSSEEIEAEFTLEMSSHRIPHLPFSGRDRLYETNHLYKDGYINTYSSDGTPSGFMEENY